MKSFPRFFSAAALLCANSGAAFSMDQQPASVGQTTAICADGKIPDMNRAVGVGYVWNLLKEKGLGDIGRMHKGEADRYFHTERYGWISLAQFSYSAAWALFERDLSDWPYPEARPVMPKLAECGSSGYGSSADAGFEFGLVVKADEPLSHAFFGWAQQSGGTISPNAKAPK